MNKDSKIYIAGHNGMVGSAIKRNLEAKGFTNIVTRSKEELNLLSEQAVSAFFAAEKPEIVVLAAAHRVFIHAMLLNQ
jgi:GDP-L-fucose synthase